MSEKQEAIADIIAEIRRDANVHCSIPTKYLNAYADRLEAALKRELESMSGNAAKLREDLGSLECQVKPLSLDDAISHADEVAGDCSTSCKREHKQLADWLRELKNRRNGSGDAAKLREALKLAIRMSEWCGAETDDPLTCCELNCIYQKEPHGEAGKKCPWKKIRAALSTPPRNCGVGTAEK